MFKVTMFIFSVSKVIQVKILGMKKVMHEKKAHVDVTHIKAEFAVFCYVNPLDMQKFPVYM